MNFYDEEAMLITLTGATLLFMMFYAMAATAEDQPLLPKCESTLRACDEAVQRLQQQVVVHTDAENRWKKDATGTGGVSPLLLGVTAGTVSGLAGGAVASPTSGGVAKGAVAGALFGLAVGIIFGGGR